MASSLNVDVIVLTNGPQGITTVREAPRKQMFLVCPCRAFEVFSTGLHLLY